MKIHFVLLACILSAACARNSAAPQDALPRASSAENCPVAYVLAPANYIVELTANSRVKLDPAWHEFELYCSLNEAGEALNAEVRNGKKQPDEWKIFSLAGDGAELARYENGRRVLAAPAIMSGWENWPQGINEN